MLNRRDVFEIHRLKNEGLSIRKIAANFSEIRHIALNMLRHEKSSKVGIKNRRLMVAWDNDYLLKVLGG